VKIKGGGSLGFQTDQVQCHRRDIDRRISKNAVLGLNVPIMFALL
jgi:hypothetical protein